MGSSTGGSLSSVNRTSSPLWILNLTTMNDTLPIPSAGDAVEPVIPDYIFFGVTIMYSILFIIGVSGNVLVIFVVWRNRDMRNSTNLFLTNLSVSDLMVIMICMPSALLEFYCKDVWHLGEAMCEYLYTCHSISNIKYMPFFAC